MHIPGRNVHVNIMLIDSDSYQQTNIFGTDFLALLDPNDPLVLLAHAISWDQLETSFARFYSKVGRPSYPIRRMAGLLMLKFLENLSDELIVLQWKRNPYYQYFCGEKTFQNSVPCHATELVKFRHRIGKEGVEEIFKLSAGLHGAAVEEKAVNIDTTVQEKI